MILRLLKPIVLTASLLGLVWLNTSAWATVTLTPAELGSKVQAYLAETTPLEDPEATLHVELLWLPGQPITMKGDTLNVMLSDARRIPLTGRTIVQAVLSSEVENRRMGIPVRLSVEKPVWVAKRLIRAQETIKPGDVILQRKHLGEDSFYAVAAETEVSQLTSRTNIPPGAYLDARQVIATPSIYRNDDVYLVIVMPTGLQIKIMGKALENGTMGKRIRVSQKMGNNRLKTYVGEVTAKNVVTVKI